MVYEPDAIHDDQQRSNPQPTCNRSIYLPRINRFHVHMERLFVFARIWRRKLIYGNQLREPNFLCYKLH